MHAAGRQGFPAQDGLSSAVPPEVVDRALARLAGASLLTFSVDGSSVSAHRLVMRVIREQLAAAGDLMAVCEAAAQLLDAQAVSLSRTWYEDRAAVRDLVEQITALHEPSAECPAGSGIARSMIPLRFRQPSAGPERGTGRGPAPSDWLSRGGPLGDGMSGG